MNLQELKTYVEQHVAEVVPHLTAEFHSFVAWVEGKQAEAEKEAAAVTFLETKGYVVTKPAA